MPAIKGEVTLTGAQASTLVLWLADAPDEDAAHCHLIQLQDDSIRATQGDDGIDVLPDGAYTSR